MANKKNAFYSDIDLIAKDDKDPLSKEEKELLDLLAEIIVDISIKEVHLKVSTIPANQHLGNKI